MKMWLTFASWLVGVTKGVVKKSKAMGVPEGWKKSPLLRNCFPLALDAHGRWSEDAKVRLDDDLGLVYEPKDAE